MRLLSRGEGRYQVFTTSAGSELFVAMIKCAALQAHFGLLAVEAAALSFEQIPNPPPVKDAHRSFDAEIEAAARAIKALLGGKEGGFQTCFGSFSG